MADYGEATTPAVIRLFDSGVINVLGLNFFRKKGYFHIEFGIYQEF